MLQAVIVGLEDNSAERKTGDNLLIMIFDKIEYSEKELHVHITGFVSDDGGDSRKARKLLSKCRPELIVLPCCAHQVGLQNSCTFACLLIHTHRVF